MSFGNVNPMLDEGLKQYATPRQAEYIDAVNKHGGYRQAARALGVTHPQLMRTINAVRIRASLQGFSPQHDMTRTVPEPFFVKGVSTYYNKEGKPVGQWVKSQADVEARKEIIKQAFEAMAEDLPRLKPIKAPKQTKKHLCNMITLTDTHVGMLAWHKETGADWDLKIAEATLVACFEHMIDAAPDAEVCLINQLGDFLHSDGLLPVTPNSGHILDTDGRFSKIVQTAIRIIRRIVDVALMKHKHVVLLLAEGNHDLTSSIWLRCMFKALYENEPRIQVIDTELPYYAYKHGETMLAFHHGHLSKNDALPLIFAATYPEIWGATRKRYCHTGHRHHVEEKEHAGMTVVQHPTLAARDAYAARGGWISERQASVITYHDQFGQVARNTVTPEMV